MDFARLRAIVDKAHNVATVIAQNADTLYDMAHEVISEVEAKGKQQKVDSFYEQAQPAARRKPSTLTQKLDFVLDSMEPSPAVDAMRDDAVVRARTLTYREWIESAFEKAWRERGSASEWV